MRVVLLGDSHLARVRRGLGRISGDVLNAAVGGSRVHDLAGQARACGLRPDDVVVISVGTNDAAPWKAVPLDDFTVALETFLAGTDAGRLVVVTPPGVDEHRLTGPGDRTDHEVAAYAGVAARLVRAAGGEVLDARALLAPLGRAVFTDDGVHLTGAAYDLLLPAISGAVHPPGRTPGDGDRRC
ncbi:MAG: SGNH/GDSL hydrolase family protein [Nocardioides sp.]